MNPKDRFLDEFGDLKSEDMDEDGFLDDFFKDAD